MSEKKEKSNSDSIMLIVMGLIGIGIGIWVLTRYATSQMHFDASIIVMCFALGLFFMGIMKTQKIEYSELKGVFLMTALAFIYLTIKLIQNASMYYIGFFIALGFVIIPLINILRLRK